MGETPSPLIGLGIAALGVVVMLGVPLWSRLPGDFYVASAGF